MQKIERTFFFLQQTALYVEIGANRFYSVRYGRCIFRNDLLMKGFRVYSAATQLVSPTFDQLYSVVLLFVTTLPAIVKTPFFHVVFLTEKDA